MLKLKQMVNSIFMYVYLHYYRYKLRTDSRYMLKEALKHHTNAINELKDKK